MELSFRKLFLLLLALFGVTTGQEIGTEIGTDICACSPTSYRFTLDFSLTCPPVNIPVGDAVAATDCLISPFGAPDIEDLVPVSVDSVNVLELGQNFFVVAETNIEQSFNDGDTFTYTSIVADPDSIQEAQEVPIALQINIVGNNQAGDRIINLFIVTFTNQCDAYPVFEEGQYAGWLRFTDLGPGSNELCPLATEHTTPPTRSPSDIPTTSPAPTTSVLPSTTPSSLPSVTPSVIPSESPSILPSESPSILPSVMPSILPTMSKSSKDGQGASTKLPKDGKGTKLRH